MVSTVEPPLSICRIQWLDFRESLPANGHEIRYLAQFDKLVDAIEQDRLNFDGAQGRLHAILQPIDYDEPARHLARFTGREWVLAEVQRWLATTGQRVLWIAGDAGVGKTALSAWLCSQCAEISAAHYCRYNNTNRGDRRAIMSLAWQLSTQLPDYADRLNASALDGIASEGNTGLFDRLFVEPFTHGFPTPGRNVVLLIDALDESESLASLIGMEWSRTPEWLRLIVTSRPHEAAINSALQAVDPWRLNAGSPQNEEDIRTYLRRELGASRAIVEAIREKSEGLFLYVTMVREEIVAGRLSLENLDSFPRGLGGIYYAFFKRYFPDIQEYEKRWLPVIETLCAAKQPLPLEEAWRLFPGFRHSSRITSGLASLFPDLGGGLRPFHQSLRDWLMNPAQSGPYVARIEEGQEILANEGWRQYQSGERMRAYYVAHLPAHFAEVGRYDELKSLLADGPFAAEVVERLGLWAVLDHLDSLLLLASARVGFSDLMRAAYDRAQARSAILQTTRDSAAALDGSASLRDAQLLPTAEMRCGRCLEIAGLEGAAGGSKTAEALRAAFRHWADMPVDDGWKETHGRKLALLAIPARDSEVLVLWPRNWVSSTYVDLGRNHGADGRGVDCIRRFCRRERCHRYRRSDCFPSGGSDHSGGGLRFARAGDDVCRQAAG